QIRKAQQLILKRLAVHMLDERGEEDERIGLRFSHWVGDVGQLVPLPGRTVFALVAGEPHARHVDPRSGRLLLDADLWPVTGLGKLMGFIDRTTLLEGILGTSVTNDFRHWRF